ncbi:toll/interleukin-1 receptor domain-containing protein [Lentzea alba]|uniref:macro domain-containing protein n=1 Tax=Lentzea alba TaxID=2714351 RepID=UPI0039BF83F1
MSGVFVSYRVREQPGYATLVHRELSTRFGADQVFLASRSIQAGEDYVASVFGTLRQCAVLLAIMGPQWSELLGDPEQDWVYREIHCAFEVGLRVIPVLVEDAELPPSKDLPQGIAALARCQSVRLRHYSIGSDMSHLVRVLRPSVPALPGSAAGRARARLPSEVSRVFKHPGTTVRVVTGDLFDQPGQLVVGFTSTFDTDTTDDLVISASAVQGQLLHKFYGGSREELDRELDQALSTHTPTAVESASAKRFGKLARYPVGTVVVLRSHGRRVFCPAYSEMGNDLVARSTVDLLWASLRKLWDAVAEHGKLEPLAMPVVGSELARINPLDRENLLKMILMSYVTRSREAVFCREFTVVVHPKDAGEINMPQVAAYLRRL